jgi:hypothetical protein
MKRFLLVKSLFAATASALFPVLELRAEMNPDVGS